MLSHVVILVDELVGLGMVLGRNWFGLLYRSKQKPKEICLKEQENLDSNIKYDVSVVVTVQSTNFQLANFTLNANPSPKPNTNPKP